MIRKAIVIGATSGIGRELVKVLAENNYEVGITGRRHELLLSLQNEIRTQTYIKPFDISKADQAMQSLEELIQEMGGVDLVVINSGTGFINLALDWDKEIPTIDVNVIGFCAMANVAMRHFLQKKAGHLVAISSIAALRGGDVAPAYSASKAFMSNYMEGLRKKVFKMHQLPIAITDVKPGFVDTDMAKSPNKFWVASPKKAAEQIFQAIQKKKSIVYITKRWRLIAWLNKWLPNCLFDRI